MRRFLLGMACAAVLVACEDKKSAPSSSTAPPSAVKSSAATAVRGTASALPSAAESDPFAPGVAIAPELDPNGWIRLIKTRPVAGKPGDRVWAAVLDTGGMAGLTTRVILAEVVSIGPKGDTATLKDARGNTFENVSGGVLQPRADASKLKPGALVTALNGANLIVAALAKADAKSPRVKAWDEGSGKVAEFDVDAVEPIPQGIAPLAWVVVPGDRRALVFAVEGEKVWTVDSRGAGSFDKGKVKAWTPATQAKVGDPVSVASGGAVIGGKVTKVVTPGLAYAVEVTREGKKETVTAFAGDVASP